MNCAKILAIGLLVALSQGCGNYYDKNYFVTHRQEKLARRASFDLNCSEQDLSMKPLGAKSDGYDLVGVDGCGKKGTYVEYRGSWIQNTETSR